MPLYHEIHLRNAWGLAGKATTITPSNRFEVTECPALILLSYILKAIASQGLIDYTNMLNL
jgi:hypothetical protein